MYLRSLSVTTPTIKFPTKKSTNTYKLLFAPKLNPVYIPSTSYYSTTGELDFIRDIR
jgi:hypothetical protein